MKQAISDEHIIDYLNTEYGIKVAKLTFLPIGADMNASVYKAEAHDQTSYFIKLKRGHHHGIGIAENHHQDVFKISEDCTARTSLAVVPARD